MTREKKTLTIVREPGKGSPTHLPSTETLDKCRRVATTAEGAAYWLDGFTNLVTKLKFWDSEPVQTMVNFIKECAHNAALLEHDDGRIWRGATLPSQDQKFQQEKAAESFELLTASQYATQGIDLDFAVSNDSELMRGYSSKGGSVDSTIVGVMDDLFNAWLFENHMISKGGVIYDAMTEKGKQREIKTKPDEQGNPVGVRADADTLRKMVTDEVRGFEQYVHQHNKSVQIAVHPQPYPEHQAQAGQEAGPGAGGAV